MKPVIVIEPYNSFHSELLYPKYQQGLIAWGTIPPNLSITSFIIVMGILQTQTNIFYAAYNGENVALFERRGTIEGNELHACWFTTNRKKRLLTGIKMIEDTKDAVIYVPKDDADGHFALARKGYLNYKGEKLNMHLFDNRDITWADQHSQ